MKNRKRDNAEVIEVPSSPEDMSMDADPNRFEVQHRETAISNIGAKSDLQQLTSDQVPKIFFGHDRNGSAKDRN